jgi:hypothetical protein
LPKKKDDDFPEITEPMTHGSFSDLEWKLGMKEDGSLNSFPIEELAERTRKRQEAEDKMNEAIRDQQADDDLSGIDDIDELFGDQAEPSGDTGD